MVLQLKTNCEIKYEFDECSINVSPKYPYVSISQYTNLKKFPLKFQKRKHSNTF